MKTKIADLKLKYESFKKRNENPYTVKSEALKILEAAKENGENQILDEVEDILMDVQITIDENKCNCNCSSC